jgi:nickel-dependent lactate racemase
MKMDLPYLNKSYPLELPDENLLAVLEPNEFKAQADPKQILADSLSRPCGTSLDDFLRGANRVLIIVNDGSRLTPTGEMLESLGPFLEHAGLKSENLSLLVATGVHRGPTESEYRQILGPVYGKLRSKSTYHDLRKAESMINLGATKSGTPVLLNKAVCQADRIIVTGSVEPHYFAGFTGGRTAFLPGIAAYPSIKANHKLALSPQARSLALEGNPVHEDMMDALALIPAPVFSFMTVLDQERRVIAAASGDIAASFYTAAEYARKIFRVPVPALADIVVSVAKSPMSINLYQSQKALDNGGQALKDGGTLILVSPCRDGIGDKAAYALVLAGSPSPADALEKIEAGYKFGYHKAAKMAALSARATVKAVTEIPALRLRSLFIEPAPTPQVALDEALKKAQSQGIAVPKVIILPDGGVTVPEIMMET